MIRNGDHQQGVCPVKYLQEVWTNSPGIQCSASSNTSVTRTTPFGTPATSQLFFNPFKNIVTNSSYQGHSHAESTTLNKDRPNWLNSSHGYAWHQKNINNSSNQKLKAEQFTTTITSNSKLNISTKDTSEERISSYVTLRPTLLLDLGNGRVPLTIPIVSRSLQNHVCEESKTCFWETDNDQYPKIRVTQPQMVFTSFSSMVRKLYYFMDPHWTSRSPW